MQDGMVVGPLDLPVSCFETDLLISYWIHLPHFLDGFVPAALPPLVIDGEEEYEVEDIIAHCYVSRRKDHLVRWKGYSASDDSWEPATEIRRNCSDLVCDYESRQLLPLSL